MISELWQDTRYAFRQLRKAPGFTLTAMLTLAIGIGANSAIFTLIHAVLLKNLPVASPQSLVRLGNTRECCINSGARSDGNYGLFSTDAYELIRKNASSFEEITAVQAGFAYAHVSVRNSNTATPHSLVNEFVAGNYFQTFGLKPEAGRLLTNADDQKGAPLVGVLSYPTWKTTFGGDPAVVGSTFWVNTKPVTIIGIAPQGFYGDRMEARPPEIFLPLNNISSFVVAPYATSSINRWLYLVGRLKPGANKARIEPEISALLRQSLAAVQYFPKDRVDRAHISLMPAGNGIQQMSSNYREKLKLLMGVSGLVLLIACANIANLLLVRGIKRKTELSVRTALGAKKLRIIRQLITESLLLSVLSGAAGIMVSYLGTKGLLLLAFPGEEALPIHISPSPQVLAFAFLLAILTGLLFGVAPAWTASRAEPADAMRNNIRTTTGRASLLQSGLVVLQATLSLVLLVGAGLFSQSLSKLQHTDLKMNPVNRYVVRIDPQNAGYKPHELEPLYHTMEVRFHAIPGVRNVGLSTYTPLEDNNWGTTIRIAGKDPKEFEASYVRINGDYFNSVGTHILMGRGISESDRSESAKVIVVNQQFAKDYLKGLNPIRQHVIVPEGDQITSFDVVGVAEDTVYTSVAWKDHRMMFFPIAQRSDEKSPIDEDNSLYIGGMVIETDHPMPGLESLTQKTLSSINPDLSIVKFLTLEQQISDSFTQDRLLARLTMLFGVLALMLASVGLYGVTAYSVAQRNGEIGIRMALGAQRFSVITMVMRGALTQTLIGLALGIPLTYSAVRFIEAQLYETHGVNGQVLGGAILTLSLAATLAGLLPAKRAASINPVEALRME